MKMWYQLYYATQNQDMEVRGGKVPVRFDTLAELAEGAEELRNRRLLKPIAIIPVQVVQSSYCDLATRQEVSITEYSELWQGA